MDLVEKYMGEARANMGRAYDKGLKELKYAASPQEVKKIIKKYKMNLVTTSKQKAVSGGELENFIIDWDGYRLTLADAGQGAVERQRKAGRHLDRYAVTHIYQKTGATTPYWSQMK